MQKKLNVVNKTKRKINEKQWNKWARQYCRNYPIGVYVIYTPFKKKIQTRGGYIFKEIYVFVNKDEKNQDLDWIFLHELGHWIVEDRKELEGYIDEVIDKFYAFVKKKVKIDRYYEDELSYEEFFADTFAILVLGKDCS